MMFGQQDSAQNGNGMAGDMSSPAYTSAPPTTDNAPMPPSVDLSAAPPSEPASYDPETTLPASTASSGTNSLLDIKQQALQQLSPLVGHLDQTPEEKFRTTMMMIQASDDPSLIQAAYEAAQGIQDEKMRAQALLDVVNEINYFTSNNK